MFEQSSNRKVVNRFLHSLIISISLFAALGILMYLLRTWFVYLDLIGVSAVITIFACVITGFIGVILVLTRALIKKRSEEQGYFNDLKKFKDFIYSLHHISTELEAYEVLFNFVQNMPGIDQTTLFYQIDNPLEDVPWENMTNSEIALCSATYHKECLAKKHISDSTKSIAINSSCIHRQEEYKKGSFLCLPILHAGYIQSVLQLYSKKEGFFTPPFIDKIKSYLDISIPVINSKRTMHILNKKATTDKLTKVYNRGFLEPYLENQIEAANLSNQQLAIIMVDIDHFKTINDTLGHAVGDHILVLFTELTLKCLRKSDLIARYGGDEFIIVLPATDMETAKSIAERIRQTLENTRIPPCEGVEMPAVTCSLGIAAYPLHCENREQLIKCSDIALYKAKQSGRNNTVIYDNKIE